MEEQKEGKVERMYRRKKIGKGSMYDVRQCRKKEV